MSTETQTTDDIATLERRRDAAVLALAEADSAKDRQAAEDALEQVENALTAARTRAEREDAARRAAERREAAQSERARREAEARQLREQRAAAREALAAAEEVETATEALVEAVKKVRAADDSHAVKEALAAYISWQVGVEGDLRPTLPAPVHARRRSVVERLKIEYRPLGLDAEDAS